MFIGMVGYEGLGCFGWVVIRACLFTIIDVIYYLHEWFCINFWISYAAVPYS